MIINLFSIFDPSIVSLNYAWAPCYISLIILFSSFLYNSKNKIGLVVISLCQFLYNELTTLISPHGKKISALTIMRLFFSCLIINVLALTPFSFTPTAHLSISFTLALTFWGGFMIIGWTQNFSFMISHLVPSGTPIQLINFIVLIELVRNLIRPITLSVRLSANIVAGHLLIRLLGRFCLLNARNLVFFPLVFGISILELGVSFIQAYVLATLVTLYSTEVH